MIFSSIAKAAAAADDIFLIDFVNLPANKPNRNYRCFVILSILTTYLGDVYYWLDCKSYLIFFFGRFGTPITYLKSKILLAIRVHSRLHQLL